MHKNKSLFKPILKSNLSGFLTSLQLRKFLSLTPSPTHFIFPENVSDNITGFSKIFNKKNIKGQIYYAFKSNKSLSLAISAFSSGTGIEVSSIYELERCLEMKVPGQNITASGPAKSHEYLQKLLLNQVIISVDSIKELEKIIDHCNVLNIKSHILIRVNNSISQISRFGIEKEQILTLFPLLKSDLVDVRGFSIHLNNYSITDRQKAIKELIKLVKKFRKQGINVNTIDIGGGFTVNYISQESWKNFENGKNNQHFWSGKKFSSFYPFWSQYPKEKFLDQVLSPEIVAELNNHQIKLFIEPGRSLLDQCGITLMKIIEVKEILKKQLILVDGNINHLSEQWFNTDYLVNPILISLNKSKKKNGASFYIGGNLCLEADMLSWHQVELDSQPYEGDWLAWINTAGYQMDSNETEFHQIPLPKKQTVIFNKLNGWQISNP